MESHRKEELKKKALLLLTPPPHPLFLSPSSSLIPSTSMEVVIDGSKKTVTLGDVECDAKLAHVDGMRSVINKNRIDAIEHQISVMQSLENVYVKRMGRESYERQLLHLVNQLPGMLSTGGDEEAKYTDEVVQHDDEGVDGDEGPVEYE